MNTVTWKFKVRIIRLYDPSEVFALGVTVRYDECFHGQQINLWAWALEWGFRATNTPAEATARKP